MRGASAATGAARSTSRRDITVGMSIDHDRATPESWSLDQDGRRVKITLELLDGRPRVTYDYPGIQDLDFARADAADFAERHHGNQWYPAGHEDPAGRSEAVTALPEPVELLADLHGWQYPNSRRGFPGAPMLDLDLILVRCADGQLTAVVSEPSCPSCPNLAGVPDDWETYRPALQREFGEHPIILVEREPVVCGRDLPSGHRLPDPERLTYMADAADREFPPVWVQLYPTDQANPDHQRFTAWAERLLALRRQAAAATPRMQ